MTITKVHIIVMYFLESRLPDPGADSRNTEPVPWDRPAQQVTGWLLECTTHQGKTWVFFQSTHLAWIQSLVIATLCSLSTDSIIIFPIRERTNEVGMRWGGFFGCAVCVFVCVCVYVHFIIFMIFTKFMHAHWKNSHSVQNESTSQMRLLFTGYC